MNLLYITVVWMHIKCCSSMLPPQLLQPRPASPGLSKRLLSLPFALLSLLTFCTAVWSGIGWNNALVPRWGEERNERVFGSRVGIVGPHQGKSYEPIFSAELLGLAGPREVHGGAAYNLKSRSLNLSKFRRFRPVGKTETKQSFWEAAFPFLMAWGR